MSSQLTIESPNFDRIRKLDGVAIENAIKLLWFVANNAADTERRDFQTAVNSFNPKVKADAPTSNQDNYNMLDAGAVLFTGSTNFNLTGIRNGAQGQFRILCNLGSATITVKHEVTSDAANRIDMAAAADKTLLTNKFMLLHYLNSRWREVSLA